MERIKYIFSIISCCLLLNALPINAQVLDEQSQRKFDYYFFRALNAKAQGKYDQAMDLLQHCYALDSTNANVLAELGAFFAVLDERNKALDLLRRAVHFDETNFHYNMMLVGLSHEMGLLTEVIDIYNRMLALYPDKIELLFELANVYADNGDLQAAIDALNKLERAVGVSQEITLNKFRLYYLMDEKERAFGEIRQIIEQNPTDIRFLIVMGDLYLDDNQPEKALEYYEKTAEIAPNSPSLILAMVNFYERTNNGTAAQAEMQKAITSQGLDIEIKMQLLTRYISILQQSRQDISQANPLFQSLFDRHPNNTELNFIFANVLIMQENEDEATKHFEIFIKDNPDNPTGYEGLLRIALGNEDLEKIIAITSQALQHLPQAAQFYFYLGAAKYQQNRYEEALQVFKDGLENAEMPPQMKSVFLGQAGDIYHQLGNQEATFEHYNKALQLDPRNLPVLNNYAYFLALAKRDLPRAEQMSSITIREEPLNPTYLDTYGWVLFQQGAYTMARIYLERAIEHGKDNPSAVVYEQFGDVLYRTNEPERALEAWKRARELGGDSEVLMRKIETEVMDD
jgi:tetratricopeptide (TPR) repeat protein